MGDRDWDEVLVDELDIIRNKISGSLYSLPYLRCSLNQQEIINKTTKKILELSGSKKHIHLGYVYICYLTKEKKENGIFPLLRTESNYDKKIYFVEPEFNRVYTGWLDYEENNVLPECWMCVPVNGFYKAFEGKVSLKYIESRVRKKALKMLDKVACFSGVLSTVILGMSTVMFPPLMSLEGPAIAALIASGSYSFGRTVVQLIDRDAHQQTINLLDKNALPIWLNMIASAGSTALGGVVVASRAITASSGKLVSAILRYACVSVNSFGVILCLVNLVVKLKNGTLSWEDVDHLIFLSLFISNIIITRTIANHVIEAIAEEPHRFRNLFNMVKNTTYKVIKAIIRDVPAALVMELLTGPFVIMILRQIDMPYTARVVENLRSSAKRLVKRQMNPVAFGTHVFCFVYPFFRRFMCEVSGAIQLMEKAFNVTYNYIVINGRMVFKNSSRAVVAEIADHIRQPVDNLNVDDRCIRDNITDLMFRFAANMAKTVNCQSDKDFSNLCAFLADKVQKIYDSKLIVHMADKEHICDEKEKETLFSDIIASIERSSKKKIKLTEEYRKVQMAVSESKHIFDEPVYQSPELIMYYFEGNSKFGIFNQFVYDAASEVLHTETLFEECTFELRDSLFVIQYHNKVLFFFYEIDRNSHIINGLVILSGDIS